MHKPKIGFKKYLRQSYKISATIAMAAAFLTGAAIFSCSGGSSGSNTTNETESTNFQQVFTEGFRQLTPLVGTSAVAEWDGWCADGESSHQYSVLTKLFNPDSGLESVYGPVQEVESILDIIETYKDMLSENGDHDVAPGDGQTYSATVSNFEGDFVVPFFGDTQTGLTRKVVISSEDESWRTMVAYDMIGDDKAMVVHTIYYDSEDDSTSYTVFRATFNETTQILQIWAASVSDKADSFKIQFIWKGDLEAETFTLTQYTNAAKDDVDHDGIFETDGFWKVMGGGSLDDQMAFRANTRDSESDDYFVVVTMDEILSATPPAGFPADAATIDSTTYPVQSYIDEEHSNCLGYLDGFPEVEDLENWDY